MPQKRVSRRTFLKVGAASGVAFALAGCMPRTPVVLEPYVRPPEEQLAGQATWYASTCRQCPAGCGIVVRVMNGRAVKIEGNAEHPLNRGKLCARGQAGLQLLYNPDRLPGPVRQAQPGSRSFASLAWEEALNLLYAKVQAASSQVAIWGDATMSGHLYDTFQRFAHALGAPPPVVFDLYAELEGYQALGQANQQLYGQSALPSYNLSNADVVLSFGADFLGTGLSAVRYGLDFGQFRSQGLGRRGYLVQLEPRMSITAAKADQWVPIRPGTEGLVAQAILRLIADQGLGPADRQGRAKVLAGAVDVAGAAAASDMTADDLARLARLFATADHPVAIPGSPVAGQGDGPAALQTVQALNWVAGTGGSALSAPSPAPQLVKPPLSAWADAQSLIAQMAAGQVQVLLIHSGNPAYGLPADSGFLDALKKVPFVVSFSPIVDESAALAHLIVPDHTYLEGWGYEVVSPNFGSPAVSSQQPVVNPVDDTRAAADVILTVARGIPAAAAALPYSDEVALLKDALSHLPAPAPTSADVAWTRFVQHGGWWPAAAAQAAEPQLKSPGALPVLSPPAAAGADYPYALHLYLSGFLSDGRGASQTWLQGSPDPMTTVAWQTWLEINPSTAQKLGVGDGDMVRVTSPYGEIQAIVCTYPAIRPDTVALPLGEGHTDLGRYAAGRWANPLQLLSAQARPPDPPLAWAGLRVRLTPTGQKNWLAVFENKAGVTSGFINQSLPGQ